MNEQPQKSDLPYQVENPEEFARNMLKLYEEGGKVMSALLDRPDAKPTPYSAASELNEASRTISDIARVWASKPDKLAEAQGALMRSYIDLWNQSILRTLGEDVKPIAVPEASDNRFKDPEWTNNPYFDFWKQAYLITTTWAETLLKQTEELDERERQRAEFYFRQVSSAFSPSNFPMTNPEVMRATLATNAQNLVDGLEQLVQDMETSGDLLKISQTDTTQFEVGRTLAVTPGKVVFQNDVLQLIQYAPSTHQVHEVPLLVVPPWINKYYILDLTPSKSFLKYCVDQGFTVFVVSWVNPDERLCHKTFQDYALEGILAATDAVLRETKRETCNVLGYCVGGTLLGTTLAYLAQRGENYYDSVTFLTTQLDFTKAGDLLLFTASDQLDSLESIMAERGYLDGSRMANVFNMMRPRDLIWPYVVNNYLLGKKPFPFDLLYWNQDSTRMAAANHTFYLREFYNENRLAKGEMVMAGVPLDLSKIKVPIFHLAAKEDHIAPAPSVYLGAKCLTAPVEFVLAGSGHIAGVVNPPDKVKYQYWTDGDRSLAELDEWLPTATEHVGSWWPYWIEWLTKHAGELRTPRTPGETIGVVEDAPGSYVKTKT